MTWKGEKFYDRAFVTRMLRMYTLQFLLDGTCLVYVNYYLEWYEYFADPNT